MSTPTEQRVHHQVPISQFHLEQLEHIASDQVFELQVHKAAICIAIRQTETNKARRRNHNIFTEILQRQKAVRILDFYKSEG